MITLWGRNNSTNVKKVLWTLEELDLPFNQIMAGMAFGVNKEADYLAMNPNGLVPLLRDDETDATLWESNTIVRYLAAQYGQGRLWVENPARRAQGENPRYFTLRRLDFGGCRLSLATPVDEAWNGPAALDGKRIATSYPHLLKRYLDQKGISFKSCLLNGSVEVAPRAGLADAICDLVSTGATLEANGLREVEVIYRSKACLIQRDGEMADAKQQLIDRLLTRIQGVIQARESKYIMMHAPTERLEEVVALLPGAERPTILPLAGDKQRVAMHMVSSETLFWETMEKLKALGASSILVLPIEKMME